MQNVLKLPLGFNPIIYLGQKCPQVKLCLGSNEVIFTQVLFGKLKIRAIIATSLCVYFRYCRENMSHRGVRKLMNRNDIQMSSHSSADVISSATWWPHCAQKLNILETEFCHIFQIVEKFMIEPSSFQSFLVFSKLARKNEPIRNKYQNKPEQFYWWLSSPSFRLGHIQIINENFLFGFRHFLD